MQQCQVDTGVEVTVQLAIVVDAADGDYLISDILEKSINQSLTEPSFHTTSLWRRRIVDPNAVDPNAADAPPIPPEAATRDDGKVEWSEPVADGTFYYVGYSEHFGNYKAQGLQTKPSTARLRIGLANTELDADGTRYQSDKGPYDEVDFAGYIVRITDEDGDVIPEGDDVATVPSAPWYGDRKLIFAGSRVDLAQNTVQFSNVRINDGGDILVAMYRMPSPPIDPNPQVRVRLEGETDLVHRNGSGEAAAVAAELSTVFAYDLVSDASVYTEPPDEHRDFPIDTLASDETYRFTAWAVNDDDDVISPVASLRVRLVDKKLPRVVEMGDLLHNKVDRANNPPTITGLPVTDLYVTEFTVLK